MACKLAIDAADLERVLADIGGGRGDDGYDVEVIAVRRNGRRLEVRTSASYREFTAAQAGSDYYTQRVTIYESILTAKRVTRRVLISHSTMYTENEPHDDEAWAREIASGYLTW